MAPTLGSGDEVLRVARRPAMVDGPPRKVQRKQREPTRGGMEETFAVLLLKVAGQTRSKNMHQAKGAECVTTLRDLCAINHETELHAVRPRELIISPFGKGLHLTTDTK
ncbi:hypothetical protein EYF80_041277 [Liparis tanakae]|uniref:Uncharacterized protein n=1 Tax=Liparis tanakae TaxID=230148 RepID=A0A4Z2G6K2_9TELE|nr:hypothetical protein EYF80_041277 [Liparis tanakae]